MLVIYISYKFKINAKRYLWIGLHYFNEPPWISNKVLKSNSTKNYKIEKKFYFGFSYVKDEKRFLWWNWRSQKVKAFKTLFAANIIIIFCTKMPIFFPTLLLNKCNQEEHINDMYHVNYLILRCHILIELISFLKKREFGPNLLQY